MIYTIPISFYPSIILPPVSFCTPPPKNGLMIYAICPVSFYPSVSFCPLYHFAPSPHHFAPWKWFNDLCYLPMSRIILPPDSFCPLECTLFTHIQYYFAPVSFCPHIILPPYFAPWKLFHDLHYLPMSRIILPSGFILPPYHCAPYHFAPWKWFNDLHYLPMSRIILPPAFRFHTNKKSFTTKAYDRRAYDCGTSGIFQFSQF